MHTVLNVYKPIGKTPLQVIEKVKEVMPEYNGIKISYAGRLDPLAHGVLLLLAGDEIKKRDHYLDLPKTYEFTMLYGLETDTYDYLGLLHTIAYRQPTSNVNLIVNSFVKSRLGEQQQSYPPFSSKTVKGKPLFWWTKENRLDEIQIPQRQITISSYEFLGKYSIGVQRFKDILYTNIAKVQGDFRQHEIHGRWKTFFATNTTPTFTVLKFRLTCSSGTYVRGLVHELGERLGCGALTLAILRTDVGSYSITDSMRIFRD